MPTTSPKALREAKAFFQDLQECRQIVCQRALALIQAGNDRVLVGCGLSKNDPVAKPARVKSGLCLNVAMDLRLAPPHLMNLRSTFRLQPTAELDDDEWIWEYHYARVRSAHGDRLLPPRCHLHVNADSGGLREHAQPLRQLHLPTRRITLEQMVWHLVTDFDVEPRKKDWRQILECSEERFRTIQADRDHPYEYPFGAPPN